MRRTFLHPNQKNCRYYFKNAVLAAGYLITGIRYIQDADRFLADEEVDWLGAASVAMSDCMSPIAIADAVVSRDHNRDRGGIFRAVI